MITFEAKAPEAPNRLLFALGKNAGAACALALLRCAQHTENILKKTARKRFKPGSGQLSNSFTSTLLSDSEQPIRAADVRTLGKLKAGAISDLIYAGIQDEGGTIHAKPPLKNLAIPNPSAKIPAGVWPRHFEKDALRFIPAPDKPNVSGYLVDAFSKSGGVMFTLKPSVTLKGKKYVNESYRKASPEYPRIYTRELEKLVMKSASAANRKGGT